MPKKTCPNGHIYDSNIYGDECPLCPKDGNSTQFNSKKDFGMPPFDQAPDQAYKTHVGSPAGMPQFVAMGSPMMGAMDAAGETQFLGQQPSAQKPVNGTIIKQPKGAPVAQGRKLVGFLVTYNRNPLGKAYNIYEGKNFIGRDHSCDICVPEDKQMSGRHMSLLYRNVDNKFKYRDEQSSNGTFVNKELSDEGELKNYDIIRLGSTVFIFIAIPQIG